jgi:hypothetical protein
MEADICSDSWVRLMLQAFLVVVVKQGQAR